MTFFQGQFIRRMSKAIWQNFTPEVVDCLNSQINMEFTAGYQYLSMAYYFDRDDIALKGLHKYFKKASEEERSHGMKFMDYVNRRGGLIILKDIGKPAADDWQSAEHCLVTALQMERDVNASLLNMHKVAGENNDAHLCDFLETHYLDEQVNDIKHIGDLITNIRRCGCEGLGLFIFDNELEEK